MPIGHGDSELVVNQIRDQFQDKHPRLRMYQNEVWDLINNFFLAFNIQLLPMEENRMADSLVVAASTLRPPQNPLLIYEIEVRHGPSIHDNVKHSKVFEDDEQVRRFIEFFWEFSHSTIDQEEDETE